MAPLRPPRLSRRARALGERLAAVAGRLRRRRWFVERPLGLACWNLFDLGVVDRRRTGHLDVFTANHNSRQSLLENDGHGCFHDVLHAVGLDQDVRFPGWADDVGRPPAGRPGLYLYRQRNTVVARSLGEAGTEPIGGTLRFLCPLAAPARAEGELGVDVDAGDGGGALVRFSARGSGRLDVRPQLVGLPVAVTLDAGVPLERVFVGPTMATPADREFVLKLQDRHGMAWADADGDGRVELFVARGGLRGRLAQYGDVVRDELFVERATQYVDVAQGSGIDKGLCRSRQAAWVPIGSDGLHLFVSCHGTGPQLHRRQHDGRFVDVAGQLGLGDVAGDHYSWVDVDGDGCLELVAVGGPTLTVYRLGPSGRFREHQAVALRGGRVRKVAVGDYDGDGDADLFVPSPEGNTLLVNDDGRYRAVDPATLGLPSKGGVTAGWVDYDNDGLVDLHVVPGGLFRQAPGGTFVATKVLDGRIPAHVADARLTWFDTNGDGARDVLVATVATAKSEPGGGFDWTATLLSNAGARNHWLQIDVEGPPGNRHALGAVARVVAGGRTATQWVGCNEGSHFSQGHYRLYFGLGRQPQADSVTVTWPDGRLAVLERRVGDERVTITHPGRRGRELGWSPDRPG